MTQEQAKPECTIFHKMPEDEVLGAVVAVLQESFRLRKVVLQAFEVAPYVHAIQQNVVNLD
jgi:hemolysin-activating ACP:hemolysin acyltransferase